MSDLTLYIIGVKPDGPIKIGATAWLERRFQNLRSGSPWNLSVLESQDFIAKNAVCLEKILHHELKRFRMNGEWFSCSAVQAQRAFTKIMKLTKKGTTFDGHLKLVEGIKWHGEMAQLGANASVEARTKEMQKACDAIRDEWPLPNEIIRTPALLAKAGAAIGKKKIAYNTAIKYLGKRPIAQYNYQAKLKRKERKARSP